MLCCPTFTEAGKPNVQSQAEPLLFLHLFVAACTCPHLPAPARQPSQSRCPSPALSTTQATRCHRSPAPSKELCHMRMETWLKRRWCLLCLRSNVPAEPRSGSRSTMLSLPPPAVLHVKKHTLHFTPQEVLNNNN